MQSDRYRSKNFARAEGCASQNLEPPAYCGPHRRATQGGKGSSQPYGLLAVTGGQRLLSSLQHDRNTIRIGLGDEKRLQSARCECPHAGGPSRKELCGSTSTRQPRIQEAQAGQDQDRRFVPSFPGRPRQARQGGGVRQAQIDRRPRRGDRFAQTVHRGAIGVLPAPQEIAARNPRAATRVAPISVKEGLHDCQGTALRR